MSRQFDQFRQEIIAEGEQDHMRQLASFPHRVRLTFDSDLDANCMRMLAIEKFLSERLPEEDYVAFPGTSMGQHRDDVFCVFFRHSRDAIIMKLTL